MRRFKEMVDAGTASELDSRPVMSRKTLNCSSCGKEVHVEVAKGKWRKSAAEKSGGALYAGKNIVCKSCIKNSIRTPGDV